MRTGIRAWAWLAVACAGVVGASSCGGGSGSAAGVAGAGTGGAAGAGAVGGEQPGETLTLEQFPARAAAVLCDNVGGCCATNGWAYDADGCKQVWTAGWQSHVADVRAAGAALNAQAATECLAWLETAARACDFGMPPRACMQMFVGTGAPGAPCTVDFQCAPAPDGDARCEGVCIQMTRGKLDDPCTATCSFGAPEDGCTGPAGWEQATTPVCWRNDGLYCAFDQNAGSSATCQQVGAMGAECTDQAHSYWRACALDAYCDAATGGTMKCTAGLTLGSSCTLPPDLCAHGSYCAPGEFVCRPDPEVLTAEICGGS